ncbi:MAG TPA: DinB family protein, partial [Anaerolineales bacterium]|nr:DinB family protein [Anaerolineales bacterium]
HLTLNIPDAALDINWGWRDYTGEGIRFALFRTYEELLELALDLEAERARTAPLTTAQRILGQYHAAYLDLTALCLGLTDELAAQAPAEEEWPVRTALAHIVGADLGFYGVLTFALEKHRAGNWSPEAKIADADWDRLLNLTEAQYDEFLNSPFTALQTGHQTWHTRILTEFAGLTDAEVNLPSRYWEKDLMPIRFRLGRFTSHMRQHTVQIEKILAAIAPPPNEARRLIRLLYAALAQVDVPLIGVNPDHPACAALAKTLTHRTAEIAEALISQTSA